MKSLATINPNVQQPYEPSELDPGTQEAIESLQENIDKKQKELDRLNNPTEHPSVRKMPREKRLSLIKQAEFAIADWNEEIRKMTATLEEKIDWDAKAVSGKNIETDPVLAEAAKRRERQQKARQIAAEKKLKSEQTTAKTPEVKSRIVPKGTPGSVLAMRGGDLPNPFYYQGGGPDGIVKISEGSTDANIAKVVELHKNWLETGAVPDGLSDDQIKRLADMREKQLNIIDNLPDDYTLGYYKPDATISHAITLDNFIQERKQNVTPELKTVGWIDELADNEIFVFGSNEKGIHGANAALQAKNQFGAEIGVGEGLTGQTYALPTKSTPYKSLTIDEVSKNIDTFLEVAKNNPDKIFKMTPIGTNLAGFEAQEIADLLFSKNIPSNVHVPESLFKLKSETPEVETESDTKYGPGAADPNDPAFKAISEVEAKSNTPGFGRYAIYLIDPISELIEDGAIALAAKMGFPKVARGLMYLMYYEAANLVSGILDATPQAANQAALAQMDQSMILAAGIGMVDEEQYASWKEDLNNATVENIEKAMEDVEQMGSRSPLSHVWMWAEETIGAKFSPWQWGWVQDIMSSVGNQMAKLGNHEY